MFAFFLLGALAAAMVILPKSSHEDLDLDDWSFWVSDDGIGRLAKYAAAAAADDECYTDEEAAAASRIENWWIRKIQNRAALRIQQWWTALLLLQPNDESQSEESYQLVEHEDATSVEETEESSEYCEPREDVCRECCSEEKGPHVPSDESESDESEESESEESESEGEELEADWESVPHRGLSAFRDEVLGGLNEYEKRVANIVLRRLKYNLGWTWRDALWMFVTGRGRRPLVSLRQCPASVRARLVAPHVWVRRDACFAPSEIEWTQSVHRWIQRRR